MAQRRRSGNDGKVGVEWGEAAKRWVRRGENDQEEIGYGRLLLLGT